MDKVDICVIGAGVIGLAVGRALTADKGDLLVLEAEAEYGQGVSSRNSEVIHAGIYYPQNSLKARLCVLGKNLLYQYCDARNVGYRQCGKLIVATNEEEEGILGTIKDKGSANGVEDLEYWPKSKIQESEPEVAANLALFSPSTGIIDTHELMASFLAEIEAGGGSLAGQSRVEKVEIRPEGFVLSIGVGGSSLGAGEIYKIRSRLLINAAGLGAQGVARNIEGADLSLIPELHYCRGNYFSLTGASPFRHLIYPVPPSSGAGLGVHATLDMGGQVKFGPDVEYIDEEDYSVNMDRLNNYYEAVRRYFPKLEDNALSPAYSGIRPKLNGEGGPPQDFVIQGPDDHGIAGLVQLFGIESPGLTSSIAIANHVRRLLPVE